MHPHETSLACHEGPVSVGQRAYVCLLGSQGLPSIHLLHDLGCGMLCRLVQP